MKSHSEGESRMVKNQISQTALMGLTIILFSISVFVASADRGLVGEWAFEEGEGEATQDTSGNNNTGAIKGKIDWVPGKVGKFALNFDATEKTYVEIEDADSLDAADEITIAAWINPNSIYTGDAWQQRNCIVGKPHTYYLDITEEGKLASYIEGLQPAEWLVGKIDMQQYMGKWVHVATTYNGALHKLYIDGKPEPARKKSGKITVTIDKLNIGWVDYDRYFDGTIDDVRIWNRALTTEQINEVIASAPVEPVGKLAVSWGMLKLSGALQ